MRITLVKNLDAGGIFIVPSEYNREGVRIESVYVDGNKVPDQNYIKYGPRQVDLKLNINSDVVVEADVVIL